MQLFRRKRDDEPVDMNERSPRLGVKYKDLAVIDSLVNNGADLSQSRHVVYYLYAPSEAVAGAMGGSGSGLFHRRNPRATARVPRTVGCRVRKARRDVTRLRP
jgi:hypothetical protein